MKRYSLTSFVLLFAWVVAFVGVSAAAKPELLFQDDFIETPLGSPPQGWSVSANAGHLQIVEDPASPAGRAVQILGDIRRATSMNVRIPTEHSVIIVEHSLRWVKGFGLNYWLDCTADGTYGKHNVNWFPDQEGNLALRYTDEDGRSKVAVIGPLAEGWNYIRLVVNFEKRESYFELNGAPAVGPLPLWNVVDEWNEIRLSFYDTGRWSTGTTSSAVTETESYYAGVRIWGMTPDEEA